MSNEIDNVLKLAQKVADQAESLAKDIGDSLEIRMELTPIIIPKAFDQRDLAELCERNGFHEIKYSARSRRFFGVKMIELNPD